MAEQKNIGFNKGLVMSPSAGEDGEATVLHNLVVRRGELVNIEQPKVVDETLQIDGTLKFIHKVQNRDGAQENFVSYVKVVDDDDDETTEDAVLGYMLEYTYSRVVSPIHLFSDDVVRSVCAIGNTLVITADDGVYYAVWKMKDIPHVQDGVTTYTKEMGYVWLGKDFPDVDLRFSLSGEWTKIATKEALSNAEVDQNTAIDSSEKSYTSLLTSSETVVIGNTYVPFTFDGATSITLRPSTTYKLELYDVNLASFIVDIFAFGPNSNTVPLYQGTITSKKDAVIFTTPAGSENINITFGAMQAFDDTNTLILRVYEGYEVTSELSFNNDNDTAFNQVMGCASQFVNTATKDNKFVYPFFVRYALKLYDNTFVKPSTLTLMTPNIGVAPVVWMPAVNGNQAYYDIFTEGYMAELMATRLSDTLSDWKDIIVGVSIAVSSPIFSYKQGETWDAHKPKIFIYDRVSESIGGTTNYSLSKDGSCLGRVNNMGANYQEYSFSQCMTDSLGTANFRQIILPSHTETEMRKDLTSKNVMYVVKDLTIDEFNSIGNAPTSISLEEGTLSALEGRKVMADNYTSLNTVTGEGVSIYNSRLVLSNVSEYKFSGYAPDSHNQMMDRTWEGNRPYPCLAVVTLVEKGEEKKVARLFKAENHNLFKWLYYPSTNARSMRVYFCDAHYEGGEYNYTFYKIDFDLTRHELMQGSYWFDNFRGADILESGILLGNFGRVDDVWTWYWNEDANNHVIATNEDMDYLSKLVSGAVNTDISVTMQYSEDPAVFHYPNRVVQSELYNPFVFPAILQSEVGSGEIIGMASTTDALSQGQLGQFPMYLFTSEGVWAMEISKDGTFGSPQNISRDVCINPQSILQLDKAVTFCTDKGMMLLTGNSIKLLSGALDGRDKVGGLHLYGPLEPLTDVLDTMNYCHFTKALRKKLNGTFCTKFLYDYQHQLIRIFFHDVDGDEEWNLQWVYDIENDAWSTASAVEVASIVPGYPHSYIQEGDKVYQYAENKSEEELVGFVLTRPISLGNPLAMKHINDLRLLYWCESEEKHDAMVRVLASNDRVKWFRVNSLREHSAKWWRFAVRVKQTDWDALSGICVDYELTRTNKMR